MSSLVILESPFAASTPARVEANIAFARKCVRDSLERGEAPAASHLLYTQEDILCDDIPDERQWGIEAGLAWRVVSTGSIVYTDRGMSGGMKYGVKAAEESGNTVEYRTLRDANRSIAVTQAPIHGIDGQAFQTSLDVGFAGGIVPADPDAIIPRWLRHHIEAGHFSAFVEVSRKLAMYADSQEASRIPPAGGASLFGDAAIDLAQTQARAADATAMAVDAYHAMTGRRRKPRFGLIDLIAIDKPWRFLGFGTRLLRALVTAMDVDHVLVRGSWMNSDINLRAFFAKSGFIPFPREAPGSTILAATPQTVQAVVDKAA